MQDSMNIKDESTKLKILALDNEGCTQQDISEATGVAKTTLGDFLRKSTYTRWWNAYEAAGGTTGVAKPYQPRILLIDIETSPLVCLCWGLFKQNIGLNQIMEDWQILCVCAKWLGEEEIMRVDSSPMWGAPLSSDYSTSFVGVAETLWGWLDEADFVIAHNAVRFDNKKIKAKLHEAGLSPPSPYKVIDTLAIVKKQFAFTSNRMEWLSRIMGGTGKMDTGGMQLWIDCMAGEPEAWNKMLNYCDGDIVELERVYLDIRAWDNKHPNVALHYQDAEERCVVCGSSNLSVEGGKTANTNLSSFEVLRCDDCGKINRRRKNTRSKEEMAATLMNVQ